MKTVGIVGGIGPESTIDYYRQIISAYRERVTDGSYPAILIDSIDLQAMLALAEARDLAGMAAHLSGELSRLARAGADFAVLASNTPHLVFDELRRRSPLPLLSIVEAACDEAVRLGLRTVGLLGARFTMQGGFYEAVFSRKGISLTVPVPEDQAYVHERYMTELLKGVFLDETRAGLLGVVDRMEAQGRIEGLVLGGTELPLILRAAPKRTIPFLDTTRIHVERIVAELLS